MKTPLSSLARLLHAYKAFTRLLGREGWNNKSLVNICNGVQAFDNPPENKCNVRAAKDERKGEKEHKFLPLTCPYSTKSRFGITSEASHCVCFTFEFVCLSHPEWICNSFSLWHNCSLHYVRLIWVGWRHAELGYGGLRPNPDACHCDGTKRVGPYTPVLISWWHQMINPRHWPSLAADSIIKGILYMGCLFGSVLCSGLLPKELLP